MFIPLKVKTDYSLMQSLITVPTLMTYLKAKDIKACGLCDNNLFGVMEFYDACLDYAIQFHRNDVIDYLPDNSIYTDYLTTTQNDWLWEREFREEAMKWLNDGEPKLYRSMTEGNLAVMLTDISLTPNATLGRRLYSFTATVYEIAEADSLSTLDSLGIFEVVKPEETLGGGGGSVDPEPEYVEVVKAGQLYQYEITNSNDIRSVILNDLKTRYGGVLEDKDPDDLYLKSVKIFFHNRPNVYLQSSDSQNLQLITDPGSPQWNGMRDQMVLGYTFTVGTSASQGTELIFVNQQGYHQLPQNLDITHLSFDHIGDIVTIEYVMVYKEKNNVTEIVSGQSVDRTLVGQEQGVFEYNQYLGESIRAKYNFVKTGEYYQRMQYWRGICLDVEPFAIAHIQYYKEDDYNDYVVGQTGVLHMLKNVPVQDMCFMGRRMKQQDISRQRFLEDWEYVVDESGDTSKPKRNTVYTINGELKIYYKDDWYNFTQKDNGTGVAEVPIEGIINYLGNVVVYTY